MNDETLISTDMIEDRLPNDFWCAILKPMYETEGDDCQFSGSIVARSIGSVQIGATSFKSHSHAQAPELIAQAGLDHYVLQLMASGELRGNFNGVDVDAKPGDIVFIDLSQTIKLHGSWGSRITVVIPREELEKIVGWRNLHGLHMSAEIPMTRLLFSYLHDLLSLSRDLDRINAQSALDAMFTLLGASINGTTGGVVESLPANLPIRKRILAYIDDNLSDPLLGPHLITKNLRISRSSLYRTFEAEGGVARIIRDKRLDRAYRILVDERGRHVSFKEIAYRCGFHDGAQFTKAFKNRFGMSPKDARESHTDLLTPDAANFDCTFMFRNKPADATLSNHELTVRLMKDGSKSRHTNG
ncbi:helix-turn-helix domain-containing protein [Ochrobactrum sp. BD67]